MHKNGFIFVIIWSRLFTYTSTAVLIQNIPVFRSKPSICIGYTQVIDQSASGCIISTISSSFKINTWSHYAEWLAYSSSNDSSSDIMCWGCFWWILWVSFSLPWKEDDCMSLLPLVITMVTHALCYRRILIGYSSCRLYLKSGSKLHWECLACRNNHRLKGILSRK
jgi:hypothetical protein